MTEVIIALTSEQAKKIAQAVKLYIINYSEVYQNRCRPIIDDLLEFAEKDSSFFLTDQTELSIMLVAVGRVARQGGMLEHVQLYNYLRM